MGQLVASDPELAFGLELWKSRATVIISGAKTRSAHVKREPPMPLIEENYVTREMLRAKPDTLFVFGDNMKERGLGGQAREMRGEPNAIGIPTKWRPSNDRDAFFGDTDMSAVQGLIDQRFAEIEKHLQSGGVVVWPAAGIGTGLADLKSKAPRIWAYIETRRKALPRS